MSQVILQQDDLTFSPDGSEVRLRYETVEKLCRSCKQIERSVVPLNILYINQQEQLVRFPRQLFISKLNSREFGYTPTVVAPPKKKLQPIIRVSVPQAASPDEQPKKLRSSPRSGEEMKV